jgi:2-aminoethylphosphonate-pyruvate transaminase
MDADIPYLLLTPGPLTTSKTVRQAMDRDWCTWDRDYNDLVSSIRERLVTLADGNETHTAVLMQGSGSFSVEATLGTVIPNSGKMLIASNGAYGARMVQMARRLNLNFIEAECPETDPVSPEMIRMVLKMDPTITHVAVVHCETTTGMLNPIEAIAPVVREHERSFIVDAMSSFGGIPMSVKTLGIDYLISSANKCIQGVPGFGFIIANRQKLLNCECQARSVCMDLFDQWKEMESKGGKWRYTSPTHVVRAFDQALIELDLEGGVSARHARYTENQRIVSSGMTELGYEPLLPAKLQSPIITSFLYPHNRFVFEAFYEALKKRRFVLYPGKISKAPTFRVGNIGHAYPDDFKQLIIAVREANVELGY